MRLYIASLPWYYRCGEMIRIGPRIGKVLLRFGTLHLIWWN